MDCDRALIGRTVDDIIVARGWTLPQAALATGVERFAIWRLTDGDHHFSGATLRRLDRGLNLPAGTLAAVGWQDVELLRQLRAPTSLQRSVEACRSPRLGRRPTCP